MSANEPKTEWIRLVASPATKSLLESITLHSGDDNMSATVRRLIRQEAMRLGLSSPVSAVEEPEPQP